MDSKEIQEKLSAYFPAERLGWLPKTVSQQPEPDKSSALALAYISADVVMDRLDEVMGMDWYDQYEVIHGDKERNVVCKLFLKINGEWVCRSDVGGETRMQDVGDSLKTGFSDALKRAAVKWGIGRYLHYMPRQWVACERNKGQDGKFKFVKWVGTPKIPDRFNPNLGKKTEPAKEQPKQEQGTMSPDKAIEAAKKAIPEAKDFLTLEKQVTWIATKGLDANSFDQIMIFVAARAGFLVSESKDLNAVRKVPQWARSVGIKGGTLSLIDVAVETRIAKG